jgi:hypothetical protein
VLHLDDDRAAALSLIGFNEGSLLVTSKIKLTVHFKGSTSADVTVLASPSAPRSHRAVVGQNSHAD